VSRREVVLSAALVFAVALVVRAWAAAVNVFPQPEDTAYYVDVARNLLEGRGLVSDVLWSYQTPPLTFPRPAFEVWLPLPSFMAAIPMALLGHTYAAAQVGFVLVGALVPVLAWRLAADVAAERGMTPERARTLALGVGLTSAVYLPLVLHSALPDSTMPFAALVLAACLLMVRIARDPRGARLTDPRTVALGVVLGLAALTRNEAAWVALIWVAMAWTASGTTVAERIRMIGTAAVVSLAIFAPWAYRNWVELGSPLPGQAITNAFSVTGFDIFAWNDPPTLARYLAVGPARLLEMRVEGIAHNLFNVLLLLGIPVAVVGLVALPWSGRSDALRPLVLVSAATFAVTSLLFPVATTWGTFLHAAGAVHVLLVISSLLALDAGIARLSRLRGWTRPVAWLGPTLTVFGGLLFTLALLPSFGVHSGAIRDRYQALEEQMAAIGLPLDAIGPVVTDFPIWLTHATGTRALALPEELPDDVLHLARTLGGARTLVIQAGLHNERTWPAVLGNGDPGAACFEEVRLGVPSDPALARALADTRVYRIVCP
jgi:hypothetical protein